MRAVMLEIPESFQAERRRLGADRWDEMWEGVLHMVPPPSYKHQRFSGQLYLLLAPVAAARGLEALFEVGVFRSTDDYRQPDLAFIRPSQASPRGVEGSGAELLVEIVSPHDESHDKLAFYAAFGAREVLLVHPETRALELFVLRGGRLLPVVPDELGRLRSEVLGVTFSTTTTPEGPRLDVTWPGGSGRV